MEDILEDRRRMSDLRFVLQRHNPPKMESCTERSPVEISEDVLRSKRMLSAIAKLSRESGKSLDQLNSEAKEILAEMAHARSMKWIRASGFFLSKVMKSLFSRVNVNSDVVERIRPLLSKYPVIFMPSHRSYMDFLLLSFVLFQYTLPCPVICAAQDFLNMKFFANVIRHCGGFFIRRSFVSDKLYWNIFSEFVQTHVLNGDFPLEFFIEGTRSRTGKSLLPKLGMLSTAMECVIRGQIPDVVLVPIAVSFDRILEESLYANELLGIPKPKESASALLKARSVLSENYGSIHVQFGEPVFAKDALTQFGVDRSVYNLRPRTNQPLSPQEMKACSSLGLDVLLRQQDLFVVSPFAIVASLLLQSPSSGMDLAQVKQKTREIASFAEKLGLTVSPSVDDECIASSSSFDEAFEDQLRLHSNSVRVDADGRLLPYFAESDAESAVFDSRLMAQASRRVQLSMYRNQMLHFFVDASLVVRILSATEAPSVDWNELSTKHSRLRRLLKPEFLFASESLEDLLLSAVGSLAAYSIVDVHMNVDVDSIVDAKLEADVNPLSSVSLNRDHPLTSFLDRLLLPFIAAYHLSFHFLQDASLQGALSDPKSNAKLLQAEILRLMLDRNLEQYDILSLDTLSNASTTLLHNDLARKSGSSLQIIDGGAMEDAVEFLREFASADFAALKQDVRSLIPKSKL